MNQPESGDTSQIPNSGKPDTGLNLLVAPLLSFSMYIAIFLIPVFGFVINILAPLPMIYYFFSRGRQAMYLAILLSSIAIAFILSVLMDDPGFGFRMGLFYLLSHGFVAILISEMILRQDNMDKTIFLATLLPMSATALVFFAISPISIGDLYVSLLEKTNLMLGETINAYKSAGVPAEQTEMLSQNMDETAMWIVKLIPSTSIIGYLFLSLTNYYAYKRIQRKFPYLPPTINSVLSKWYPPDKTVYVLIVGALAAFMFNGVLESIGVNMVLILISLYSLAGMAVVQFFMEKYNVVLFLRLLAYSLIIVQPFFLSMVAGLGLFDLWFDFRKIRNNIDSQSV